MSMKPFTDYQAGITGLEPGGWAKQGIGLWIRHSDQSMFYQRGIPNITTEQIKAGLLPQFGLPRLQGRPEGHKTASLQWDVYHLETKKKAGEALVIDAALAQVGKWTYIVVLICKVSAYNDMCMKIFLPAVNAMKPIYTGAKASHEAKARENKYTESIQSFRDFMKENLAFPPERISDQMKGLAMPPSQKAYDLVSELISLPALDKYILKKPDIHDCIASRKSRRRYNKKNLTLEELAYLLWATQGVRKVLPSGRHYRTVPSAGSRHSFETYLVIQHVKGLKPGVYRYLPFDNKIVYLFTTENLPEKMTALASDQPFVGDSAVCFIWSSIPYRMEWRYGCESAKPILIDVGHVCQNLYLACESIGCGTCGVAAYEQDALDKFLGLNGKDEFVIYLAPVGKVGPGQME